MARANKQKQSSGDNAINVQAGGNVEVVGLSLPDAREIALAVFRENFLQLRDEAANIAFERARTFTEGVLRGLEANGALRAAQDPDFQFNLFHAQREYARTGDDDLGDTLSDLLIRRAGQGERTLVQVSLNEAIATVGKLTSEMFAALTAIWIVTDVHMASVHDRNTLGGWLDAAFKPFLDHLPPTRAAVRHLEYAGCVSVSIGSLRLEESLSRSYPGVFSKPLSEDQIADFQREFPDAAVPDGLFIPHEAEPAFYRLAPPHERSVRDFQSSGGVSQAGADAIVALLESNRLKGDDAALIVAAVSPLADSLIAAWNDSDLKHVRLTSVGTTIAHSNFRRLTTLDTDLSIWIN